MSDSGLEWTALMFELPFAPDDDDDIHEDDDDGDDYEENDE